jgi:Ni/Fe-hydrogenase subunit HybB-like protein
MTPKTPEQINSDLLRPLFQTSVRYLVVAACLAALVAAAFAAWGYEVYAGIGVAGIRRPVFWAFYITNFVFWLLSQKCNQHSSGRGSRAQQ